MEAAEELVARGERLKGCDSLVEAAELVDLCEEDIRTLFALEFHEIPDSDRAVFADCDNFSRWSMIFDAKNRFGVTANHHSELFLFHTQRADGAV